MNSANDMLNREVLEMGASNPGIASEIPKIIGMNKKQISSRFTRN
jgi:hypothetical protein